MNLSASVSVIKYSAAVYQPSGCRFPKANWCDIRDKDGKWIVLVSLSRVKILWLSIGLR
jgi:hypothetical protein